MSLSISVFPLGDSKSYWGDEARRAGTGPTARKLRSRCESRRAGRLLSDTGERGGTLVAALGGPKGARIRGACGKWIERALDAEHPQGKGGA